MDWVALVFTALQLYLLGQKNKWGFLFGLLGAAAWIYVNISLSIWGGVISNVIIVVILIHGWWSWDKTRTKEAK